MKHDKLALRSGSRPRGLAANDRFRAAVFDMDGTLVDNMRFHTRAWVALASRLGRPVDPTVFEHEHAGKKNDEILPWLVGRELSRAELDALAHEKESTYRELYRSELTPMPGLLAFLDRLERGGVACAVATAAPPGNRELVLGGLDIARRFAKVIGAEHAPRGKPSPDIVSRRRARARARARGLPRLRGCGQRRAFGSSRRHARGRGADDDDREGSPRRRGRVGDPRLCQPAGRPRGTARLRSDQALATAS